MFNFSKWWDARCFEVCDEIGHPMTGRPMLDIDNPKVVFIPGPLPPPPVYLKDSEREHPPWQPSNDWEFTRYVPRVPGETGQYSVRFDSIDFDNDYLTHRNKYGK